MRQAGTEFDKPWGIAGLATALGGRSVLMASRATRVLAECAAPTRVSNSSAVSLPASRCPRRSSIALSRSASATSSSASTPEGSSPPLGGGRSGDNRCG